MKFCTGCGVEKTESDFYRGKTRCKSCVYFTRHARPDWREKAAAARKRRMQDPQYVERKREYSRKSQLKMEQLQPGHRAVKEKIAREKHPENHKARIARYLNSDKGRAKTKEYSTRQAVRRKWMRQKMIELELWEVPDRSSWRPRGSWTSERECEKETRVRRAEQNRWMRKVLAQHGLEFPDERKRKCRS